MSTNPNNAIGTNGAFGGRTSVNAFNDVMGGLSRGVLSGWGCVPNSGLTVSIGGNGTTRDVAIAMDNAGNKTSINNVSNSPVNVTIGSAPGTNSRIDSIVAYVDNPPSGTATGTDNPSACGLVVVEGTTASSPVVPTEAQIRTAITADGASGTTAYYVVLANITMASGTTDITSNMISAGDGAQVGVQNIGLSTFGNTEVNGTTDVNLTSSSDTTVLSFVAPTTGTFFVFAKSNIDAASVGSDPYCTASLKIGSTVIGKTLVTPSATNRTDVTVMGWGTAKVGDTISFTASVANMTGTARYERTMMGAIRVG